MTTSSPESIFRAMSFCRATLQSRERWTQQDLEDAADLTLALPEAMLPGPRPSREELLRHLQATYSVTSEDYGILDDGVATSWFTDLRARGDTPLRFWLRYKSYLADVVRMNPDTINRINNLTDEIMNRLVDPSLEKGRDKRGMVVGQVQSGKTGNYIGLVNKAADAGYRVIVVLAGIHESLRSQTQLRLDQGFVGVDTQTGRSLSRPNETIGVGRIDPSISAHWLTSSAIGGDFSSQTAGRVLRGDSPVLLVVKKNAHILRSVIRWMAARGEEQTDGHRRVRGVPLLVIDDEADNASINVSKQEVSTINRLIRHLLEVFEKRSYVGYTATPFANIFIPLLKEDAYRGLRYQVGETDFSVGQDLFPRDFIVNLPPPTNYIGPARIFGMPSSESADEPVEPLDVWRCISDYRNLIPDRHKKDDELPARLPESLHTALKCFFLVCAARAARKQTRVHNSMLVHVSRFIRWQDHIASLLDQVLKTYQDRLEMSDPAFLKELETLWLREFDSVTRAHLSSNEPGAYRDPLIHALTWEDVLGHLREAVARIRVRAVHGDGPRSGAAYRDISPLDYFDEETKGNYLSVVAVGGDKLSRGLTLEGLSVSYYLRASRMYDTLMQMGRWFGYRPGYADLCRLFTSSELHEWYRHITIASEELRREFDFMVALHRTPGEYGLKIRSHPGVLKITAANKFRYAQEMELSYSNTLNETYALSLDRDVLQHNRRAVNVLLNSLAPVAAPGGRREAGHIFLGGSSSYAAVQDFLRLFKVHGGAVNGERMAQYIGAQIERGMLTDWTVVLLNRQGGAPHARFDIHGQTVRVGVFLRERDEREGADSNVYWIKKNHIISPAHQGLDLDHDRYEQARRYTAQQQQERQRGKPRSEKSPLPSVPSGEMMRRVRGAQNGLLLIYPLVPGSTVEEEVEPVMGYAVSFPFIVGDQKISYYVNEQFQMFGSDFDFEFEADEIPADNA